MASAKFAGVDANGDVWDDTIPDTIARTADVSRQIQAAVEGVGVTAAVEQRLAAVEASVGQNWYARTGGVLSGARDPNGTYPIHPVTTEPLVFYGPRPLSDGNRVAGTGRGMDIVHYPPDSWVGPA